MITEPKPRRSFPGVIQSIVDKSVAAGDFFTVTLNPRPGMKFPDSFHGRDMALKGNWKAGDSVVLTLEQGKPKKENPQYEADFWWNVIGVEKAREPSPGPQGEPSPVSKPAPGASPKAEKGEIEREDRITAAHLENMRAAAYQCATPLAIARGTPDMASIKKLANDFFLSIMGRTD